MRKRKEQRARSSRRNANERGPKASRRAPGVGVARHVKENFPPIYNRVFSGNMFLYSSTVSRSFLASNDVTTQEPHAREIWWVFSRNRREQTQRRVTIIKPRRVPSRMCTGRVCLSSSYDEQVADQTTRKRSTPFDELFLGPTRLSSSSSLLYQVF